MHAATLPPLARRPLRRVGHLMAWQPQGIAQWLLLNAGLALAYWLFSLLGAAVAIGPASVSVLWPPNGLALACVMAWGARAMPGLLLGALLPDSMLAFTQGLGAWEVLAVSVLVRLGSAAQWWGMALLLADWRWLLRRPGSRFTRRFVGGTLLFCTLAPTVGVTVLMVAGRMAPHEGLSGWLSWWVGDVAGMLVVTPLLLAALHPAMRRHVLHNQTFPVVALGLGMTLAGTALLGHLDRQSLHDRAGAQSREFAQSLRSQMALAESDLKVLAALHYGTQLGAEEFEGEARELRKAHEWVSGFAYLRVLPHAEREAFEATLDQNLRSLDAGGALQRAAPQSQYWVATRLAPVAGQEARLGFDEASDPARRQAIESAMQSGRTTVTEVIDDPQFASTREWGVLLYRPVYEAAPGTPRPIHPTGLVSATLTLRPLVGAALSERRERVFPMLLVSGGARRRALLIEEDQLQELDTGAAQAWLKRQTEHDPPATVLRFGSSDWTLHGRAETQGSRLVPSVAQAAGAALGLCTTALLAALMVVRARREEELGRWRIDLSRQVAERTAELCERNGELRLNAQALGEREALLSSLLRAIPDPVWMKGLDGRYLIVNPAFAEDVGMAAEQLIGLRATDLLGPEQAEIVEAADRQALEQAAPVLAEQMSPHPNGSLRLMMQLRVVVRDAEQRPLGLLRLAWDITEQRQREQDLAQARDRAEDANRAKSSFLSNISHEIRTPLNAVLGFAQLLGEDEQLTPASRAQVQSILRAGQRLLRLINDVLDLSKIEAGALQLLEEPVELHAELGEIVQLLQPRVAQHRVQLALQRDFDAPLTALLDRGKFGQAVLNLLANALKFSPAGAPVQLHARLDAAGHLLLTVADQGPGIAVEELASLFQPFQQGEAGARHGGTGLGLVLSRRLIEAMGGELWLDSQLGQGTRAHIRLPLRRALLQPMAPDTAFAGTGWRLAADGRCRVLVAEDDADSRTLLVGLLERLGCDVQAGEDGAQALRLAQAQDFDIVLSDMRMPVLDGPGLRAALALDTRSHSWPVVAVTASSLLLDREQFIAMGFADYVPKPYAVADMLRVLQQLAGARFVQRAALAAPTTAARNATTTATTTTAAATEGADLHEALRLAHEGRALELRQWLGRQTQLPPGLREPLADALARYDLQTAEALLQSAI